VSVAREADWAGVAAMLGRDGRLEQIYRCAVEAYPRECCGMVMSSGAVRPCDNAQDALHAADPEGFQRTSLCGYTFAMDDQLFLARSFEGEDAVRVVYHSHPDGSVGFSAADRSGALAEGCPLYPELAYLVVGCRDGKDCGARLYAFIEGAYREAWAWKACGE